MPSDSELLSQFADRGDEAAFAEVVRRQADLVYSVARRVTANASLAQDVTQSVLTKLARQAGPLSRYETIVGWLHTTTRYTAIDAIRGEERRRAREQEATAMQNETAAPSVNWEEIGPLLDEAVDHLREHDRQAVLLRFFKNLSHQEVGEALGLSEDTARKRVDRALDKLRAYFSSRGVTASSAVLAAAISTNSVQAAPVEVVAGATSAALAGATNAGAIGGPLLLAFIMSTKTKTIVAIAVILAVVAVIAVKMQSLGKPAGPVSSSTPSGPSPSAPKTVALSESTATIPSQVEAPVVKAEPMRVTPGATASPVGLSGTGNVAPPANADLKTGIPAMIHFLETDDFVHIVSFLMTPDQVQEMLSSGKAGSIQDLADNFRTGLKNHGGADFLIQGLQAIRDQTPILDESGNKAVYLIDPPIKDHKEITFVKKDGLWYGPQ